MISVMETTKTSIQGAGVDWNPEMRKYEIRNGKTQLQYRILNGETMSLYSLLFVLSHRMVRTNIKTLKKIEEIPSILWVPAQVETRAGSVLSCPMRISRSDEDVEIYRGADRPCTVAAGLWDAG